ncbi:carbohydrate ABC transporter permease [Oceanispirochaeta sp.]|uniref:carbohydrate ABC transporter permease n=1 Tax=Oceanispirochaeta sp. TaxID=2035350 RepID=UPI0026336461|nr:sugar ABC transporter permease [Oceanispirochaeta sp.]MDA3958537.1 sugar ABC transporter permease [Oceanispirochaeta sp.]
MNRRDRKALLVYIGMVAPGLLVYLFIVAYPVFYSVWLSITDFNPNRGGEWSFVGLLQYKTMVEDPYFWHSLKNNMIVVAVSVFGQIPVAFVLAYILFRNKVKGGPFFQSMVFLPQFLSTIVIGILWKRMFSADGPVSKLIQIVSRDPMAQFDLMLRENTVMYPIGFALIWMYTGFYMIIFLANLQKMNVSMIEAAKIDGATEPQIFGRVILPLMVGTIVVSTILAIAGSLRGFDLIFAMTTQGLQRNNAMVLPIFMYQTAFQDYRNEMRFAYGSAISNAIVFISIGLILFSNFIGRKFNAQEEY